MRTRTFVLIGVGLALLSALFLTLGQLYAMYRFEITAGMGWLEFIRWHAWRPGFTFWQALAVPHDLISGVLVWFGLQLPGVALLGLLYLWRGWQWVVLSVIILMTGIDLLWLLQGCGYISKESNWCALAGLLHDAFTAVSVLLFVPIVLAVRQQRRMEKGTQE